MRSLLRVLVAFALLLGLPARAQAKLHVVATVNDLGAIAQEVAGEKGEVTVLARSTQDPHFVDARPNLMLALNKADCVLLMGAELEVGWLPVLLKGARNPKILHGEPGYVDASTLVPLKEVPTSPVDRSMGDIHPTGNPHFTTDPNDGIVLARAFAERFAELDPADADTFRKNAQTFEAQAKTRVAAWQQALAPFKGTPVVTYHRSWIYFTDFAGLRPVGTIEPKPGIPPNASHVAQLITQMKSQKVPLVLQESWYGSATSEIVAQQTGAKLVVVPGQTREGQKYLDHLDEMVQAVVRALGQK